MLNMKLTTFKVALFSLNVFLLLNFVPIKAIDNNHEVYEQEEDINTSNIGKLKKDVVKDKKHPISKEDIDNTVESDGRGPYKIAGDADHHQQVLYTNCN